MPNMTPAQLTKLAIAALEDVKGVNIELIDVAPLTSIADHMVICTGTSNRHVKALADHVMEKAREAGVKGINSQGLEQGDWALVDLNGTLVHVMQASARLTYQLEKLWDLGQAKPRLDEPKPAKAAKLKTKAAKPAAKPAAKAATKAPAKKSPAAKAGTKKPAAKTGVKKAVAKTIVKAGKAPARQVAVKPAKAKAVPKNKVVGKAKPVTAKTKPQTKPKAATKTKPTTKPRR